MKQPHHRRMEQDIANDVGRAVTCIRRRNGLSQEAMANYLGLHQATVCRVEHGQQDLSAPEFIRLETLFGVRYDFGTSTLRWGDGTTVYVGAAEFNSRARSPV